MHGGKGAFKSGICDSPTNTNAVLDQNDDDDDPMLAMLSNTNQNLPDYTDSLLISEDNHLSNLSSNASKNTSKSSQAISSKSREKSPRKKSSKGSAHSNSRGKNKLQTFKTNSNQQVLKSGLTCKKS